MTGFVVIVDFRLKAGAHADFRRLVDANASASVRHERGCRRFDVVEPRGEADRVLLYEIYDDEAAFEEHCRSSHYTDFDSASEPLVDRKAVIRCDLVARGNGCGHELARRTGAHTGEERWRNLDLKEMAGTRSAKLGHFVVEFATPGIGHILKSAGCDFVLFDLEHSGFGFETVKSAIRYFEAADLPAIVRVPSREYHHIARAMDMGAEGLMLPMVGNPDEVRHIVELDEVSSGRQARRRAADRP